jgi:apolipoprotein N-acyltransferase
LVIESRWPICVLGALSFGMMSLIFAPIDWWPLAYVCLVPWLVAVTSAQRTTWMYLTGYLLGTAFWLLNIHWLYPITPPGHMVLSLYLGAYWPLIAWLIRYMVKHRHGSVALVLPFVWVATEWLRSWVVTGFPWFFLAHSQHRVLTMIQVSDLAGAYGLSFLIAAVNGWIVDMLIQPILVWRNMAVRQPRRVPAATLFTAVLLAFTIVYGRVQLRWATVQPGPKVAVCQQDYLNTVAGTGEASPPQMLSEYLRLSIEAGRDQPDLIVWPETAAMATLNQEFLSPRTLRELLTEDANELYRIRVWVGQWRPQGLPTREGMQQLFPQDAKEAERLRTALRGWYLGQMLDRQSAEKLSQTDMQKRWRIGLYFGEWDYGHLVDDLLGALARGRYREMIEPLAHVERLWPFKKGEDLGLSRLPDRTPAWLVTGGYGYEFEPSPTPPHSKLSRFNSAYVYAPSGKQVQPRYDKIHCVLFGEYVPFRYTPLHWLYAWLNSITPWGASGFEYSLTAGERFSVYQMQARSQDGRSYRFAIPICYEDTTPDICRQFVQGPDGDKRVDFLLNISNDGWFNHSDELPQHMVGSVFRAVENRVGVARAVNTGISGFVDPTGYVHDCVASGGRLFGPGIIGTRVSTVWTDTRHSLYTRWGDWFAQACAVLAVLIVVDAVIIRPLTTRRNRRKDGRGGGAR